MRTSFWGVAGTLLAGASLIAAVGVSAHTRPESSAGSVRLEVARIIGPEYKNSILEPAGIVASPDTIASGEQSECSVSLNQIEQTDTVVAIDTDVPTAFASIPTSVTVPAGQLSADFTVQAASVSTTTYPTISADLNGGQTSFTMSVTP